MNVILDKGQNLSNSTNLNYVAKDDKIYIIDNHLAAIWCFSQLDTSKIFNLLHIDRHYDLVPYDEEKHSIIHSIDFKSIPVDKITSYKTTIRNQAFQLLTWDNYLNLFNQKFPNTIDETIFITQKEDSFHYAKKFKQIEIFELFQRRFDNSHKWIFNIDLDYFFSEHRDNTIQVYSDAYIKEFALWLKGEYANTELIILCLSPECCGGWDNSNRILELIKSNL